MQFDPILRRASRASACGATARLVGQVSLVGEGRGQLLAHHERPWASITFAGTSHEMVWVFRGDAVESGERLIAEIREHQFALPGQLVADVAIDEVDHRVNPASLTVRFTILVLDEG